MIRSLEIHRSKSFEEDREEEIKKNFREVYENLESGKAIAIRGFMAY